VTRCNPFGYGTDAGPRHLMGGMYGPEYAGRQTLLADGIHGPAACTEQATHRARMVCAAEGHTGPIMDLCDRHWRIIQARMSGCCTRCVWPDQARGLNEDIERAMAQAAEAYARDDQATAGRLRARVDDLARQMDELRNQGIIRKVPLELVEVS
jgi:hypothetical protein